VAAEAISSEYFANVMLRSPVREPRTETTAAAADTAGTSTEDPAEGTTDQPVAAVPAGGTDTAAALTEQRGNDTGDVLRVDPAVQQEVAGIIARSAVSGELSERDRTYLTQLVATNSDLDQTAARARVDEVTAEIDDARATALVAVEQARVAGVIFGFIAAATLLIGAVAAFLAAAAGGRHRDEGLGLDVLTARR
jgi:hypothetical protein